MHCYHSINQRYYLWIAWRRFVFLLPIAVHRQSSLDFLVYLVRPLLFFTAPHMIYWLKCGNQYLNSGDYWACRLSTLNGDYRGSVVRTYITIYIRQLLYLANYKMCNLNVWFDWLSIYKLRILKKASFSFIKCVCL